jgi:hypothetical protein
MRVTVSRAWFSSCAAAGEASAQPAAAAMQ